MGSHLERMRSLLDSAAPAVLSTSRKDGSVKLSPVWFRHKRDHFEVVITDDDVKLKHIRRDPRVTLVIFETVPPFRGVIVTDVAEITAEALDETRRAISSRYLDDAASAAFTRAREGNGSVVRIPDRSARSWDLGGITGA